MLGLAVTVSSRFTAVSYEFSMCAPCALGYPGYRS